MQTSVRLALASSRTISEPAFEELRAALREPGGVELEPVYAQTYDSLRRAVASDRRLLAWAPPLIAHDLLARAATTPLVAVSRRGATSYYGALVTLQSSPIHRLTHLRGSRIGWVSTLSAAGYVLPRLYLESLGADPDATFDAQTTFGTHGRTIEALLAGDVDVIATHARLASAGSGYELDPPLESARVLAAAGPIPGDLIVAGLESDRKTCARVRDALLGVRPGPNLARLMHADRFVLPTRAHIDWLTTWERRATSTRVELARGTA